MKRISNIFMAVAALFAVWGCGKEVSQLEQIGSKEDVTIKAIIPQEFGTRAISDGSGAVALKYSVYDLNGNHIPGLDGTHTLTGSSATINMKLVKNLTYRIVFWAQNPLCTAYNTENLAAIKVNYSGNANDETRDAFYAVEQVAVKGAFCKEVVLRRPFAQINFGASDIYGNENYSTGMLSAIKASGLPDTFEPLSGKVSGEAETSFVPAPFPGEPATLVADGQNYSYISMNYLLASGQKSVIDKLEACFIMPNGSESVIKVSHVPVQANYRTNILGSFFTGNITFNIKVDSDFTNDYNKIYQ